MEGICQHGSEQHTEQGGSKDIPLLDSTLHVFKLTKFIGVKETVYESGPYVRWYETDYLGGKHTQKQKQPQNQKKSVDLN